MKKLAVILAVTLVMAIAIPLSGCGSSSNPAKLTFIARPNTGKGPYTPSLYILDPVAQTATPVAIPIPATADYVSANSDATAVTYCRPSTLNPTITPMVSSTYDIYLMGKDGTEKQLTTNADACESVFSPDGKTIAYASRPSGSQYPQIFTMNIDGTNQKALYTAPLEEQFMPQFSPDGKSLVFLIDLAVGGGVTRTHRQNNARVSSWLQGRDRHANNAVRGTAHPQVAGQSQSGWYTMALTGTTPTLVYSPNEWWGPAVFSSDGTRLFLTDYDGTDNNIYSVNLDGSNLLELTTSTDTDDFSPVAYRGLIFFNRFNDVTSSVDIYGMDETGVNQIFLHSTPDVWEGLNDTYWEDD